MNINKLKKISGQELQKILDNHKKWLATDGKEGEKADFDNTFLADVDFSGFDLRYADFREAYLLRVKFCKANLRSARFRHAYLAYADFEGANLSNADFYRAVCHETYFVHADLNDAYIDGSAFPLWDGVLDVNIDDGQANMFLYLLVRSALYSKNTSEGLKAILSDEKLLKQANKFREAGGLGKIKGKRIPEQLLKIKDGVVINCDINAVEIVIPDGVTGINDNAFADCASLTRIVIPNGVTSIGYGAFSGCAALTHIAMPDSITSIGQRAFDGCTSLVSVTMPNSVTDIGDYVFANCSEDLVIRCYSNSYAEKWARFKGIKTALFYNDEFHDNTHYFDKNGNEIKSGMTILMEDGSSEVVYEIINEDGSHDLGIIANNEVFMQRHPDCEQEYYLLSTFNAQSIEIYQAEKKAEPSKSVGSEDVKSKSEQLLNITNGVVTDCDKSAVEIVIPVGVTCIDDFAFAGCKSLKSVIIPDGVISIEHHAFWACDSLVSIVIPESVTNIGVGAFEDCSSLKSVKVLNDATSIGKNAFAGCSLDYASLLRITSSPDDVGFNCVCNAKSKEVAGGEIRINIEGMDEHHSNLLLVELPGDILLALRDDINDILSKSEAKASKKIVRLEVNDIEPERESERLFECFYLIEPDESKIQELQRMINERLENEEFEIDSIEDVFKYIENNFETISIETKEILW